MRRFVRTIDFISIHVGQAASFLGILIAAVIVYEVILRAFFNMPTNWAHETSGMMFGALFMLGAAYVMYYRAHVRVDILVTHFPLRVQALVDIITHLLMALYCYVVLWKGWNYAVRAFVRMEVTDSGWQPVLWPIKWVLVIGMTLLVLQLLAKYIRDFHMLFTGKELE